MAAAKQKVKVSVAISKNHVLQQPMACRGGHAVKGARGKQCGVQGCEVIFWFKRTGDLSTFPSAEYEAHLKDVHGIELPKAILVFERTR